MSSFKGKTALITGAAVGIGRACAFKFAENGSKLVLLDWNAQALASVKEELAALTTDVLTYSCDVSDENAVNAAIHDAVQQYGRIDFLVNNAALWRCWAPFVETPTEEWERFLDINVMGVVHCTKAVLPAMLQNGYGSIVNVASVAGVYGNANMVHYSATKGALIAMTKALAKEVADKGVRVNCVSPGSVSPAENMDMHHYEPSELAFMGRTGTDMENAELICFLCDDAAAYIDGQNIQIDGCRRKQ